MFCDVPSPRVACSGCDCKREYTVSMTGVYNVELGSQVRATSAERRHSLCTRFYLWLLEKEKRWRCKSFRTMNSGAIQRI